MWAILQRAIVPLVLLIAGIASTISGAKHHLIPVVQEHEEEVSIPMPTPFGPGPEGPLPPDGPPGAPEPPSFAPGQMPGADMPPGGPPAFWQPPPALTKVIKKVIITTDEPEPKIIREVSVGGLTLADSGEIKRTYTGDEGPALCPT